MRLAVLMDSPHLLKPYKDTTIAMIKAAQKMGWFCCYFTVDTLVCKEGHVFANLYDLQIGEDHSPAWAQIKDLGFRCLHDFDIVLMRKDPPFNIQYIYATYFLDLLSAAGVLVANNPQSLRDANEKFFTLQFPQCCPPTLVSQDIIQLKAFWEAQQNVIFKPLAGMGGQSVFHVDKKGDNLSVILELLTNDKTITIMAQTYIPEITTTGDKRILLIHGEPIPYALARIPKKGELRGNLAAGASGQVVALNERDRWICKQLSPILKAKRLYFVGIDVIGDYLTEINVTSPTCAREIMQETGLDIGMDYLTCLAEIKTLG